MSCRMRALQLSESPRESAIDRMASSDRMFSNSGFNWGFGSTDRCKDANKLATTLSGLTGRGKRRVGGVDYTLSGWYFLGEVQYGF